MSNKKETTKKVEETVAKKVQKPKAARVNYKLKYEEAKKENLRLNTKIRELVFENSKNIEVFQTKAKGFQAKAQEEVNKVKEELRLKSEADALETKKYGAQKLLENILEPLSNIDMAIAAGEKQDDPGVNAYVQGFKMLMGQLFVELEDYGITVIEPKEGQEFDPELHHVFSMIEDGESNTISQVKKKGYKLHDRVIKPAVVVVFK